MQRAAESHSAVGARIERRRESGSEGEGGGKFRPYEHTGTPYVWEVTRVRVTEQISGHYSPRDPGPSEAIYIMTQMGGRTNTAGHLSTGKCQGHICPNLSDSARVQKIKYVRMG